MTVRLEYGEEHEVLREEVLVRAVHQLGHEPVALLAPAQQDRLFGAAQ